MEEISNLNKVVVPQRRRLLFEKELTKSDVNKVFVIPKRYTKAYFPQVPEGSVQSLDILDRHIDIGAGSIFNDQTSVMTIIIIPEKQETRKMGLIPSKWNFKYCQRKCSTNFVSAKGWKHFVKQAKLMPKHKISFYANEDSGVFEIETGLPAARNAKGFMLFGVAIIP
nr:hypothetical protein [Tanacetum cinerariifolium]